MINIAICDDEWEWVTQIDELVRKFFNSLAETMAIQSFTTGEELAKNLERGAYFDIIFLDIEMVGTNGVMVGKQLRENIKNNTTILIYVSSHQNYVFELFEVQAFRFLLKPLDKNQFTACLQTAYQQISAARDRFFECKTKDAYIKLPLREILYFEKNKRLIKIVTQGQSYEFYGKLPAVFEQVQPYDFLMIHQSYLINYDYIKIMRYEELTLTNGEVKSISYQKRKEVRYQYLRIKERRKHVGC